MESRIVELYVSYTGTLEQEIMCKLVFTDAPDNVIKSICLDIQNEKKLNRNNGIDGIIGVLKARGYECVTVDNIPKFGFTE